MLISSALIKFQLVLLMATKSTTYIQKRAGLSARRAHAIREKELFYYEELFYLSDYDSYNFAAVLQVWDAP